MKGKDDRFQEGLMRKGGVNLRPSSPRPESPSGQQVSNNKIATIEGTLLKMGYKHTIKNTNDILRLPYIKNTEWSFEFEGCPHISSRFSAGVPAQTPLLLQCIPSLPPRIPSPLNR